MFRSNFWILPILLFIPSFFITAQNLQAEEEYLQAYDRAIGLENTALFNGVEYVEEYRTINNKHQFFFSRDFILGDVLYDAEVFYNVALKFDIFNNRLIAELESDNTKTVLQLITDKVGWFKLGGKKFINVGTNETTSGFLELIAGDETSGIFKKYVLNPSEKRDKQVMYYEFNPRKSRFFYSEGDGFYPVDSRRDLINIFPEEKKAISEFYKSNKSYLKNDKDQFMTSLYTELLPLLTAKNREL
ncbi:hypothetical protein RM549_14305 [Salegentibacter sp. F188]|uniref:Uncharacterized protein n=1 Tax=Autumnicola patrickiae TaxID=3075591 RepID=A0ABU3E4P6_9FLAO|nr:hypothetical protein [Salegentibacter sp. F188]MDT0690965.1 hypothetical protein [Salegentibacter sp. F188]